MEPARHRGIAGRVQLHPDAGGIAVFLLVPLAGGSWDGRSDVLFCFRMGEGMTFPGLTDRRARLMLATLGFLRLDSQLSPVLHALHRWLDSWRGIGDITVGMVRQGYDLQLARYDEQGWRATFHMTGMEHSATSAVQGAAREALRQVEEGKP